MKNTNRHPDIEKYCKNPQCGKLLERKRFGKRPEDYALYKRRMYCDQKCYLAHKHSHNMVPADETNSREPAVQGSAPFLLPGEKLSPREHFERIMNDHTQSSIRRDNAAKALLSADIKGGSKTKKQEQAEKAQGVASGGRFTAGAPPLKVVGGK